MAADDKTWPSLASPAWPATYATLHLWTQIVGKIRLALGPRVNHWWGAALYLTSRGLTTSPIPYGDGAFEIVFDFIDHTITIGVSDGRRHTFALQPRMVADFYEIFMRALDDLHIRVRIWPMPVEVPEPIRFTDDHVHAAYDADAAHEWWRALLELHRSAGIRADSRSPSLTSFWSLRSRVTFQRRRRRASGADAITLDLIRTK